MTPSRLSFLFGAALLTIAAGLLVGQDAAQFIQGRAADVADLGFRDVGNRADGAFHE